MVKEQEILKRQQKNMKTKDKSRSFDRRTNVFKNFHKKKNQKKH